MRSLWRYLRRIFGILGSSRDGIHDNLQQRRRVEDYTGILNEHPGTRLTTIRLVGRAATDDNVMFLHECIETEDAQGNARRIDVYDSRVCGFNHLLDQSVRATALCRYCGRLLCSTEGCAGRCLACGISCCSRHRRTFNIGNGDNVTYCLRCSWLHYWKKFWGLYK